MDLHSEQSKTLQEIDGLKSVRFVVKIFLDKDRPNITKLGLNPIDTKWVRTRISFMKRWTLQSLENQTFRNFEIWIICGQKFKHITSNADWSECSGLYVMYDGGKRRLSEIDSDFISITRIDSDDLFHKDAMQEVMEATVARLQDRDRRVLIFKKNLEFNIPNMHISKHYRKAPPFFTHIFPRRIYKNFKRFIRLHDLPHGKAGGMDPETTELSTHKVCVLKHGRNNSLFKRNIKVNILSPERRARAIAEGKIITVDHKKIAKILIDFGVEDLEELKCSAL